MKRGCGVLLPITSLPSKNGIGCFSKEAYDFIDWLCDAGQGYWQILPLGPTSFGDSPYQSFSTFAGNPYMISLEKLKSDGLLYDSEIEAADLDDTSGYIDYGKQYQNRYPLLKLAFERAKNVLDENFFDFCDKNSEWLDNYALFMSAKNQFGGKAYYQWNDELKFRNQSALERFSVENYDSILFQKFLQYRFFYEWSAIKAYANKKGIKIIGDMPIYVARDSADVWTNNALFQLDNSLSPTFVAGCPPDDFSKNGQLWGNPLYDWKEHRKEKYLWWKNRIKHSLEMYDMLRIDHFRGFDEYFSIPFSVETAVKGIWEQGPGYELFESLKEIMPKEKIIVEDLGFVTSSVKELVRRCGFMNMKIIEFAFDNRDKSSENEHMPHNYNRNSVVYTATHDNQTLISWFSAISDKEQDLVRQYLNDFTTEDRNINLPLIALAYRSVSELCIIPIQDWLGLDDSARINIPSTIGTNWRWRLTSLPTSSLSDKMMSFAKTFSRYKKVTE